MTGKAETAHTRRSMRRQPKGSEADGDVDVEVEVEVEVEEEKEDATVGGCT